MDIPLTSSLLVQQSSPLPTSPSLSPKVESTLNNPNTLPDLKRKNPLVPSPLTTKKSRNLSSIAERTYFDPEIVTIIPHSQLTQHLQTEKLRKLNSRMQLREYHLPDDHVVNTVSSSPDFVAEEAGLNTPPPPPPVP